MLNKKIKIKQYQKIIILIYNNNNNNKIINRKHKYRQIFKII